jgi:mono/diheme cytochrome c family protein
MLAIFAVFLQAAGIAFMVSTAVQAAEVDAQSGRDEAVVERELIPGAHLMTAAERDQYRARMNAAGSAAEQARIRAEHIEAMEQRARALGLSLSREVARGQPALPPETSRGDVKRGAALHNVCFSCHGPERYRAAGERASGFLTSALVTAGGIPYVPPASARERRPDTLPAGYPKMGRSQVRNLAGLRKAIARWNDYFNPKLTDEELDDLVAYLNAAYYKF